MFKDIYNALKLEAPQYLSLENKGLEMMMQANDIQKASKYVEEATNFDPFKNRIMQALSKGLTEASIDHTAMMENEIYQN